MATPNGFDHLRRGEPSAGLGGRGATGSLDYLRRGEPSALLAPAAAVVAPALPLLGVGA